MPELPEVETLSRQLASVIAGTEILAVKILDAKLGALKGLKGRRVLSVTRQGKGLVIGLDDGRSLRIHLRMTGRLLWREKPRGLPPHTRMTITLDRGRLDLIDPRRFATVTVGAAPVCAAPVGNPLEGFDAASLIGHAERRTLSVKAFLLDQKVIAGIGNIYACEILHEAAVHPGKRVNSLSKGQWRKIAATTRAILEKAVECRGTSISDWRDLFGEKACYQEHLRVYGREGEPCPRCGGIVSRVRLSGRGTYFCPACQK